MTEEKEDWNRGIRPVPLMRMPKGMSPFLMEVLDSTIEALFKRANADVSLSLIAPLRMLGKTGTPLDCVAPNATKILGSNPPAHLHRSVLRRAAMGSLWKNFVTRAGSVLPSSTLKTTDRRLACPPMDFASRKAGAYPCRSMLCPHCHCRTALATMNSLKEQLADPASMEFFVLRHSLEFEPHFYGYDARIDEKVGPLVRKAMSGLDCICVKTLGAEVSKDKVPSLVTCFLVAVPRKSSLSAKSRLSKARIRMIGSNAKVKATLMRAKGLEDALVKAYDLCPVVLGTLGPCMSDCAMHHAVESYCTLMERRKKFTYLILGKSRVAARKAGGGPAVTIPATAAAPLPAAPTTEITQ